MLARPLDSSVREWETSLTNEEVVYVKDVLLDAILELKFENGCLNFSSAVGNDGSAFWWLKEERKGGMGFSCQKQ